MNDWQEITFERYMVDGSSYVAVVRISSESLFSLIFVQFPFDSAPGGFVEGGRGLRRGGARYPSLDFSPEQDSAAEQQQERRQPDQPIDALFRGLHHDVVAVAAMKVRPDFIGGLALNHTFSNGLPHLMGQGRARFPNVFGLAHGASKRFGNLAHLLIDLRFIHDCGPAHGGEDETQQDQNRDKTKHSGCLP